MPKIYLIFLLVFIYFPANSSSIEDWSLIKNLKISAVDDEYINPISMQFIKNSKISNSLSYYILEKSGKIFLSYNKKKTLFADIKESINNINFIDFNAIDLCIDQETASLFATFNYKELQTGKLKNGLIKFENSKIALSAKPDSILLFDDKIINENLQENVSIGSCLVDNNSLYFAINNTSSSFFKNNKDLKSGVVIRVSKNNFKPHNENPYYLENTISNENYVFAYGFKNITSFLKINNDIFFTQNGNQVDSFGILERGKDYMWNGDDKSIAATSEYLFSKYQGFTNMTFIDSISNFPDNFKNKILIISKGKSDNIDNKNGKNIWLLDYDFEKYAIQAIPKEISRYTGIKNQVPIEIEFFNNSIYFFGFNIDNNQNKSKIYKLNYLDNFMHSNLIGDIITPISLINKYNCTSCHIIHRFGKLGAGHAPKLTIDYFTDKFNNINSNNYSNFLKNLIKTNESIKISKVIEANNYDKIYKWLSYYLVNPQIYDKKNQMANLNISEKEALVLARYLIGSKDEFNYKIQSSFIKKIKKFAEVNIPKKSIALVLFICLSGILIGILFMYFIYLIRNKLYINRN